MKITLELSNLDNIGDIAQEDLRRFEEIFEALVVSGGLTGVKGGKTIIHFDIQGVFQRIQLDYSPWIRRKT